MSQITQTPSMQSFQSASGIDPSALGTGIVSVTVAVTILWAVWQVRGLLVQGWEEMEWKAAGIGLFLTLFLLILVIFATGRYTP